MTGDAGADTFVFTGADGHDVITDFVAGTDILQIASNINGSGIASADDVAANATQVGSDTVIDLGGGNTLTLVNTDVNDVHADPGAYFHVS